MALAAAALAAGAVGEAAVVCAMAAGRRRISGAPGAPGAGALEGPQGHQALAALPSAPPPDDDLGGQGAGEGDGPGGHSPGHGGPGGLGGWPEQGGPGGLGGPDGPDGPDGPGGPEPAPADTRPGPVAVAAAVRTTITFASRDWAAVQELVASGNPHAFPFAHGERVAHRDPTWLVAGWDLRRPLPECCSPLPSPLLAPCPDRPDHHDARTHAHAL
jgi:hypothetical protein